jgi:nucleoside permease NupC
MFSLLNILLNRFFLYYVSVMRGPKHLFFVGNILLKPFSLKQILTVVIIPGLYFMGIPHETWACLRYQEDDEYRVSEGFDMIA